jgi:hypothetical protein
LKWHISEIRSLCLEALITEGFSAGSAGEDQFDTMVGLCGMLDVVDSQRSEACPDCEGIARWEGRILSMASDLSLR